MENAKVIYVIIPLFIDSLIFMHLEQNTILILFVLFSESCIINSYKAQSISFDKYSGISPISVLDNIKSNTSEKIAMNSVSKPLKTSEIYIFYSTTDIRVESVETLVDFNSFISSIGGSLGLFLGFSFWGFLSFFYDCIKALYTNINM